MIQIFLINLHSRPDRLEYVSSQLKSLDLNFKRIQAIVVSELSAEEQKNF